MTLRFAVAVCALAFAFADVASAQTPSCVTSGGVTA